MKYYDEETGCLFNTMEEFNKHREAFNEEKRKKENLIKEKEAREQEVKQKADELDRAIRNYVKDYGYLSQKLTGYLWNYII